jgi:hypothetical protein
LLNCGGFTLEKSKQFAAGTTSATLFGWRSNKLCVPVGEVLAAQ